MNNRTPNGELAIRTLAMPEHCNPSLDIFGGWIMSQCDIAGGTYASQQVGCRVVTVSVDSFEFRLPVKVGDVLSVYAKTIRIGHTSIDIKVEAWARRAKSHIDELVTEANFRFVALNDEGRPTPINQQR